MKVDTVWFVAMAQAWASYWFTVPLAGADGVHSDIKFHAYHYTQVGAANWLYMQITENL